MNNFLKKTENEQEINNYTLKKFNDTSNKGGRWGEASKNLM